MSRVAFDKLGLARKLESAGIQPQIAHGISIAFLEVLAGPTLDGEKISQMEAAGALTGTELVPLVRVGVVQNFITTVADIVSLVPTPQPETEPHVSVIQNTTITASQSGTVFDNYGAGQQIDLDLPPWQVGLSFSFVVASTELLAVIPNGSDRLSANGELYASLGSAQLYASLGLSTSNLPGIWITQSMTGSWSG